MAEVTSGNGLETQDIPNLLTNEEIKNYLDVFPEIMEELVNLSLNTYPTNSDMSRMTAWMSKVVRYHIPSEPRLLGGLLVPAAHKSIMSDKADSESLKLAYIMGWGLEICHGAKLLADNIMDQRHSLDIDSEASKPAWHTKEHVGMTGVNDNFVLKVANYNILKIFFADKPYYYQLQDSARDGYQKGVLGRALWEQMEKGNCLAKSYSMERYKQVVSYMTSYYSFYMPVESALIMAGLCEDEPELKTDLKELMIQIGYYHQLVKDFENIFGKRKVWLENASGKMRRLTWFFAKALQICNENQAEKLIHFTNDTEELKRNSGDNLKKLYMDMNLIGLFNEEKSLVFTEIQEKVKGLSKYQNISVNFFHKIIADIEINC